MNTIANRLKQALEMRNMKQADLVNMTGIGKSSISTYLSGDYEPKQKNLYRLAKALDVNQGVRGSNPRWATKQEPSIYATFKRFC